MAKKQSSKASPLTPLPDAMERLELANGAAMHAAYLVASARQLAATGDFEDSRAAVHKLLLAAEKAAHVAMAAADEMHEAPYRDPELLACIDDGWAPDVEEA